MPQRKSTVKEIKERFDKDVERFSNLDIGQTTTVDAAKAMNLTTTAAALTTPKATNILDIGCGAGNYTLKLLQHIPDTPVTLIDLSKPMLDRAQQRISEVSTGTITTIQGDIREIELGTEQYDIVLAAAVLHHLRTDNEWTNVFKKIYDSLRPGGSFWIFDLVTHTIPQIQEHIWKQYGEYLVEYKDTEFRELVYGYITKEDTPKSLTYQTNLLQKTGFKNTTILHKNLCYAAFGAIKPK
jgi:tRNA (cmo5U34)-methyltransferase